jgi:hypothetical protein
MKRFLAFNHMPQAGFTAELLPIVLDKAFKGELV